MLNYRKIIATFVFMIILAIGVSLVIKPAIGIGTYDAVSKTISNITNTKVGTITTVLNAVVVLLQFIILWNDFRPLQLFQIGLIAVFGYLLNFMLYNVLTFELNSYISRFIMFIVGNAIVAFGAASIINMDYILTPLEGLISAFVKKTNGDFVRYRMYFDIGCLLLTVSMAIIFNTEIVIREGSIIAAIIFSPMMGVFMKLQRPLFKKIGLISDQKEGKSNEIEEILEVI